jgi:hypothetical protein
MIAVSLLPYFSVAEEGPEPRITIALADPVAGVRGDSSLHRQVARAMTANPVPALEM